MTDFVPNAPAPAYPGAPQPPTPTVVQAAELVAETTKRLTLAEEEEQRARHAATNARNAVNQAQKLFDDAVMRLKSEAPSGSDWKSQGGEPARNGE